jgi:hypothetical protein
MPGRTGLPHVGDFEAQQPIAVREGGRAPLKAARGDGLAVAKGPDDGQLAGSDRWRDGYIRGSDSGSDASADASRMAGGRDKTEDEHCGRDHEWESAHVVSPSPSR